MAKHPEDVKINITLALCEDGNYRIVFQPRIENNQIQGEVFNVDGFPYGPFEGMKRLIKANREILTAYAKQDHKHHSVQTQSDLLYHLRGGHIGYEQVDKILEWIDNHDVYVSPRPTYMLPAGYVIPERFKEYHENA